MNSFKENNRLTPHEARERMLLVLIELDRFCRENNIKYMLAYGTLIGAIRHKGFIPWDDDIDVMMARDDFFRFCKEYKSDDFYVADAYQRPNFIYPFARLVDSKTYYFSKYSVEREEGVSVDIYPIQGYPKTDDEYLAYWQSKYLETKVRRGITTIIKILSGLHLRSIARLFCPLRKKFSMAHAGYVTHYPLETSDKVICPAGGLADKLPFRKEIIEDLIEVEFEGRLFYAPAKYDDFLRLRYGDYMKLPPEDQRHPYHATMNYFWYDK